MSSSPSQKPFSETYLGKLRKVLGPRLLQTPGFRILIEDQKGHILLQKRADFKLWGLPGGHPEEHESITQAIYREAREETGLTLGELEAVGFSSDPNFEEIEYPNGDQIHSFVLIVRAKSWQGTLIGTNAESLEASFFDAEQDPLPPMLLPEKRSLEQYLEWKKSRSFRLS